MGYTLRKMLPLSCVIARGQQLALPACPDGLVPMVHDSLGAPKGLSPCEHVMWAVHVDHPFRVFDPKPEIDLSEAVRAMAIEPASA